MKGIKFTENVKTGFKDKVDTIMTTIIVICAIIDLGWEVVPKGGYAFFAFYIIFLVIRTGFWKNAVKKYVTKKEYRDLFGLSSVPDEPE